jgi:hypothetical protein
LTTVLKNRRALRGRITALLQKSDFPALVELAGREAGVAWQLLQFLYAPGDLLHWRAVEGLGYLAGAHPGQAQRVIGRLLYLLNEDSGSFGWGAAAALGEIGRHQLPLVADIIPMFCSFLGESFSRASMLWGLGRLGERYPERLGEVLPLVVSCLEKADPEVRALAAWCLGKVRYQTAREALKALTEDNRPVQLYEEGELRCTTVGRVAREALAGLAG